MHTRCLTTTNPLLLVCPTAFPRLLTNKLTHVPSLRRGSSSGVHGTRRPTSQPREGRWSQCSRQPCRTVLDCASVWQYSPGRRATSTCSDTPATATTMIVRSAPRSPTRPKASSGVSALRIDIFSRAFGQGKVILAKTHSNQGFIQINMSTSLRAILRNFFRICSSTEVHGIVILAVRRIRRVFM